MGTLARLQVPTTAGWIAEHEVLRLHTRGEVQFVDLTDEIADLVGRHRLRAGIVNVQTRHTTTAVVVNEHEPLLLEDFRRTLQRVAPRLGGYAHDDFRRRRQVAPGERANGHSHCRALLLPCHASLNVAAGQICLGRWQRVFFVELDGPQRREIGALLMGS
jgi:secondary thiamine-phosphate synthase enzyme